MFVYITLLTYKLFCDILSVSSLFSAFQILDNTLKKTIYKSFHENCAESKFRY